jgi:outer membrane receptor protein involved in Fe transport
VSGVVNFILKRDFEGFRLRAQSGISKRGDAGDRFVGATWGTNFADRRGNVTLAYEFNEEDRFSQRKRLNYGQAGPSTRFVTNPADFIDDVDDPNIPDYVPLSGLRWADTSPGSAIDLDGDFSPDFTGEGDVYDPGEYVANEPFTIGGSSTPQDIYYGDFRPGNKRHIFNALTSFEFSPAFRVFAQGKYVRNRATTLSQPSYDLYVQLFGDNAFLNERYGSLVDPVNGALVLGRDNFDYGIRRADAFRRTIRTVLGADGAINDHLKYELSYVFGQVKSTSIGNDERVRDRYYAALDAVVDPATGNVTCRINLPGQTQIRNFGYIDTQQYGTYNEELGYYEGAPVTFQPGECVPLNNLGSGAPSPEALAFILQDNKDHARIRQNVVSGSVSGDSGAYFELPGGPVGFALGAEYRKESSRYTPSELAEIGQFLDSSQTSPDRGAFDVKEVFAEVNLPILSKQPFAETLSVGAAGRLSKYSTVGTTKSWSVNGVYAPVRDLSFRSTVSQAVRAPNLNELFGSATGTYEFINDPCGIDRITDGTATRQANCEAVLADLGIDPADFDPAGDAISPANTSLLGRTSGNRDLTEETARTWTAGLVLRPRFIPGLQVAADWYSIKIKQAINTPTAQQLAELCVDQPTLDNVFCANLSRDPGSGYIADFLTQPANVAAFRTAGLDLSVAYRFRPGGGRFGTFNARVNGNYLHRLNFIPTVGAEVDDNREESFYRAAKYSATGDLTWTKGPLTLNYGINWFSKTLRYTVEETEADPDIVAGKYVYIKPSWEHEFQAAVDIGERLNVYAGVNNLFDTKPDVGFSNYPVSAVGRAYYVGMRAKLW